MRNIRLYPPVVVKKQSFVGAKVHTLPSQSMSLREIILRFTRRESLPVEKQGVYYDQFGDLEKAQNLDITERMEKAEALKQKIAKGEKAMKERQAAQAAAQAAKPPETSSPNSGINAEQRADRPAGDGAAAAGK